MTDDLAAFIAARLDEDEAAAKAALRGPWSIAENEVWGTQIITSDGSPVMPVYVEGVTSAALSTAAHIARHDPDRLLRRQVPAMRAILAEHQRGAVLDFTCRTCTDQDVSDPSSGEQYIDWPCPTIRHLAAVWSDHPDYRDGWKP